MYTCSHQRQFAKSKQRQRPAVPDQRRRRSPGVRQSSYTSSTFVVIGIPYW